MFHFSALDSQWQQPAQVQMFIVYPYESQTEPWHGGTTVWWCETWGLDLWAVEIRITVTSCTEGGNRGPGVGRALASGPRGDVWRDTEGLALGQHSLYFSCFSPVARTSISLPRLTLRLFPHSFVMSPISSMNRNAVTMMDGASNYTQKQKRKLNRTRGHVYFFCLFFVWFFLVSPLHLFISSERAPSVGFFYGSAQSRPAQPPSISCRSSDKGSGEVGVEGKAAEVTVDPWCFCLFVCLLCLKQRAHGIENSIWRNSPQRLVIQRHANDIAMCWFTGGLCSFWICLIASFLK